jgi:ABC-type Fe3+ transport system permease subunit
MKLRHFVPLVLFVIPNVVIGYGFVIPRSCIAGVNELTVGFATTIVAACATYVTGLRGVLKEKRQVAAGAR